MTISKSVSCLGMTFNSDDERREYFRNELRKALPELKKIEGFPIGEDEDIIALSDPPYYTACPNPWLKDFIEEWEADKKELEKQGKRIPDDQFQITEPYASDVSEGKNNPIYNAHSYHTKVPHPAIMRYILHYTQPGDIVLDGFAGTGMTGVAAQLCGNPDAETKYKIEQEFKVNGLEKPVWGTRRAICGDLSPVASFIAYNYNTPIDVLEFESEAKRILAEVEKECGWIYETHDKYGKGKINYTVWSDVFVCPSCNGEIVFFDVAVDKATGSVRDTFNCPHCNSVQSKRTVSKAKITTYDTALNCTISQTKTVPVLINYTRQGKRYEKTPDQNDLDLIQKIENLIISDWFPTDNIPKGDKTGEPLREGFSAVSHFFSKRNLFFLANLYGLIKMHSHKLLFNSQLINISKLNRYRPGVSFPYNPLNGTLYIGSQVSEANILIAYHNKIDKLKKAFNLLVSKNLIYNGSATTVHLLTNTVDYIFTDPPFGANLMYSELNLLWESWLKVKTNNNKEAIENRTQGKSLLDYQDIMAQCFKEYYRVLKPGRWMTVEFSNTGAAVWNGIQTAIQKAGFVLANVSAIDKQQGSFNAVTTVTAVKQDLVISCYKPSDEFELQFNNHKVEVAVWDFVREHLNHLPVHLKKENNTTAIIERSPKILYDRLITFYLMRNLPVPMDAREFQQGLKQRFIEEDGMFFTADQAAEYRYKKATAPTVVQLSLLVTTESEGIEWLRQELKKPQTYQDLHPKWMQAITAIRKGDILPELRDLLQENFIQLPDGKYRVPDMNEAKDREELRRRTLLREFHGYQAQINQQKTKKLKEVRVEALRAGFKNCWEQKDFLTIVTMGDKIPQNILLEDEQLLMFYDIAKDRM
jgi:DNA modification methylase